MTVAQVDKVEKPAPAEAIAGAPPKAAKKPKSVAVEEEAEEPVKREEKAVGGAVPKKSGNLANIVDQWDETDD
jgi:hypothetical protein